MVIEAGREIFRLFYVEIRVSILINWNLLILSVKKSLLHITFLNTKRAFADGKKSFIRRKFTRYEEKIYFQKVNSDILFKKLPSEHPKVKF